MATLSGQTIRDSATGNIVYHCRDCSYIGAMRSDAGGCPACGSAKIRRAQRHGHTQGKRRSRPVTLVIVVLLWTYLLGHILWKLNSS
jgi:predicted RNA-binding Zn-ribbon protein involved in translation (DUF1610 family)